MLQYAKDSDKKKRDDDGEDVEEEVEGEEGFRKDAETVAAAEIKIVSLVENVSKIYNLQFLKF